MKHRQQGMAIAVIALMTCVLSPAQAQTGAYEVSAYGGYQFWGGIEGVMANGTPAEFCFRDASNWGGSFGYRVEPNIWFKIAYFNQSTTITARELATGTTSDLFPVVLHYVQAGAMYEAPTAGRKLTPYGGLTVGLVNFDPDAAGLSNEWRVALGLNGGVKIYLSENFGIRAQGSLLLPVQWGGGGLFCGAGGCGIGVSSGRAILQGAATGGLFVEI